MQSARGMGTPRKIIYAQFCSECFQRKNNPATCCFCSFICGACTAGGCSDLYTGAAETFSWLAVHWQNGLFFFFLNTKLLLANMTVINVRNIDEVQNWQFQRQVCYERDTPQTIKMIKFILCARGFYGG